MSEEWKKGDRPVNEYHAFCMIVEELKILNTNFDKFFRVLEKLVGMVIDNTTAVVETIEYETAPEVVEKTLKTAGMAKLPPEINKGTLDFNKVHKIGNKPCSKCHGPITWEYRPGIAWPIHVDEFGKIEGNGTCPEYKGDS